MTTLTGTETLLVLGTISGVPAGIPFSCSTQDIANLGGGAGTGTVTSVGVSGGTTGLTTSGGPITTSGTITFAGTLNPGHGGTGLGSYASGDIIYASAANTLSALNKGSDGQVLTLASGFPSWAAAGAGTVTSVGISGGTTGLTTSGGPVTGSGTITLAGTLAIANGGTNITTYTGGDILYCSATNVLSKLAKGSDTQVLTLASGLPSWAAASGSSPLTTKGDLFGFSTVNARLPVGADTFILTADSSQTLGVKWVAASGGGNVTGPGSSTNTAVALYSGAGGTTLLNSGVLVDASNNITGIGTLASGAITITSGSATSLAVGPNGATTPILQVDSSTGTAVVGLKITGGASGGGANLAVQGGSTNEALTIATKGAGAFSLNSAGSTGTVAIQINGSARISASASTVTFGVSTSATASTNRFKYTGAANTTLTAGTEFTQALIDMSQTNQHASNTAITTQRDMLVQGMTHSFASATGTITNAYACWFQAPTAGTNAVITNAYSVGFDSNFFSTGKAVYDSTITAGGTTGNQTINKPSGTVNIAAAGSSVTVTNSFCTTSSIVMAVVRTNDTTALIKNVVPGSGSFVITMNANVTAETSIGFIVYN